MTAEKTTAEIKLSPKIEKLVLTKAGEVNKNYCRALKNSRIDGDRIYPKMWANKGRSLIDYSSYIESVLKVCNYKIKRDNTAPRGGAEGDCYILSKQALQLIEDIKNYNNQFK